MTAVMTESRTGQGATLNETTTLQVIQLLSQPTPVDVSDTLVALWAESTEGHAENGYVQQARILSAILDRDVDKFVVANAMEAVSAIHRMQAGHCLVDMYGYPNTDENRGMWLDYERRQLTAAAQEIGGNR